jgi:hypothetical protein
VALSDIFDYWDRAFLAQEIRGKTHTMSTEMQAGYEPPSMALTISDGKEHCSECGREVKVMAFKGEGVCGEICRKLNDGEITKEQADEVRTARRSAHPRA